MQINYLPAGGAVVVSGFPVMAVIKVMRSNATLSGSTGKTK